MNGGHARTMCSLGLLAAVWLGSAACDTPPSAYIPPPERPEVPNLDPPPGIPVMPSASSGSKSRDAGGAPTSTIEPPTCKTDKDCAVTTRIACCTAGDPRAALRSEVDATEKECKEKQCADVEVKGDFQSAKDYIARCVTKSCTLVKKKKKK